MVNKGLIISIIILFILIFFSFKIYLIEAERQESKDDLIELSNIHYGLFSVDEWKKILSEIITKKINEFSIEERDKIQMRSKISNLLSSLIQDLKKAFHKKNKEKTLGFISNAGAGVFGIFEDMEKQVPEFTESILEFMTDPENREAIKRYVLSKLDDYSGSTFAEIDYKEIDKIVAKYGFENREETIIGLKLRIEKLEEKNQPYHAGIIVLSALSALLILLSKTLSKNEFLVITIICFTFLLSGLFLPMIEIDARISSMKFSLLGEAISFQDQVLYYKSKSILEVVRLMLLQSQTDLLIVGFLVLTFSLILPVVKLASTVYHLYSKETEPNKFIHFLIFKTGKWSMADVMVMAIFMTYIGFTGIVTEQLLEIERLAQNMEVLTTNASRLQKGFFSFTAFVILSLLTAHKLQYKYKKQVDHSN